jgi:exoribonuclease R
MLTYKIVGVLELASKYRYGLTSRGVPIYLFRPYDETLPEFVVGCSERDTSVNQNALVEVTAAETTVAAKTEKPRGTLVRLFGPVGDYEAEKAALLEHYCPARYRKEPIPEPDTADDENRKELDAAHGWTVFHVDPPGCRDIDDALAYNFETDTWAIIIADAAAAVPADSAIDDIACQIGQTFYDSAGRVVRPMLPPALSEDSASLLPGQRRRGVALRYDPNGNRSFSLVWVTVAHSFTYDSFPSSQIARDLGLCLREPHDLIAEFMILYNNAAGRLFKEYAAGILRTQSQADATAVETWAQVSPELAHMANEAATYANACKDADQGHAGLGLTAYAHASSPLRRYADLQNQRILKVLLRRGAPPVDAHLPAHLNERQRAGRRWARDLHFLDTVTPGRVHTIEVIWVDGERVWVPVWKKLLRLRHEETREPGTTGTIDIFCDPTRRNWRKRILTAPTRSKSAPH